MFCFISIVAKAEIDVKVVFLQQLLLNFVFVLGQVQFHNHDIKTLQWDVEVFQQRLLGLSFDWLWEKGLTT